MEKPTPTIQQSLICVPGGSISRNFTNSRGVRVLETGYDFMFLSTGLKRVRLLGMGTHFFPKNLARGMLIRVGTFIRDTIVAKTIGSFRLS